jgi:putative intracellular protease/amidase
MIGKLRGKKVVIIVAHEFEDVELLYPVLRLSEEGAEIVVVPVNEGLHPRPYIWRKTSYGEVWNSGTHPGDGGGQQIQSKRA